MFSEAICKKLIESKFGWKFVDAIYNSTTEETLCTGFEKALEAAAHPDITEPEAVLKIFEKHNPGNQFSKYLYNYIHSSVIVY